MNAAVHVMCFYYSSWNDKIYGNIIYAYITLITYITYITLITYITIIIKPQIKYMPILPLFEYGGLFLSSCTDKEQTKLQRLQNQAFFFFFFFLNIFIQD